MEDNPLRGRLDREHEISLSPFAPKNLVSRDGFGSPVPRQPVHSPHPDRIWCLLTGFLLPLSAMVFIYTVNRHWFSPEFLHRWFHCRESTGTGSVVLTVARVTPATSSGNPVWTKVVFAPLFPTPTSPAQQWACAAERIITLYLKSSIVKCGARFVSKPSKYGGISRPTISSSKESLYYSKGQINKDSTSISDGVPRST